MDKFATLLPMVFLVFVTVIHQNSFAQNNQVSAGLHLGYNFDVYTGSRSNFSPPENGGLALGAAFRFKPRALPIIINPSLEYYRNGRLEDVALQSNINGLYPLPIEGSITPYVGLGAALTSLLEVGDLDVGDSSVDLGLNLIGGASFDAGSVRPFIQGRYTLGSHRVFRYDGGPGEGEEEGAGLQITGGVLFMLSE